MKTKYFAILATLIALLMLAPGQLLADDVAVMKIRIGKDKEPRTVIMDLYEESTPVTVENFKKLARKRFYNGLEFHRIFPGHMVQTGDPLSKKRDKSRVGTGGPGYTLPSETGRKHKAGSLSMARLPDDINPARASNGSQFYIALKPMPDLDGEYTVFGEVIEGLEVIDEISRKGKDSNDYPVEKVQIRSLRIEPRAEALGEYAADLAEAAEQEAEEAAEAAEEATN